MISRHIWPAAVLCPAQGAPLGRAAPALDTSGRPFLVAPRGPGVGRMDVFDLIGLQQSGARAELTSPPPHAAGLFPLPSYLPANRPTDIYLIAYLCRCLSLCVCVACCLSLFLSLSLSFSLSLSLLFSHSLGRVVIPHQPLGLVRSQRCARATGRRCCSCCPAPKARACSSQRGQTTSSSAGPWRPDANV